MARASANRMPKVRERKRFDGVGMEAPMSQVKDYLLRANAVELFTEDKVVKLDIPFSELYHRCSETEWSDLLAYLAAEGLRGQRAI